MKTYPLRVFVQKVLLMRLAAAAAVIALLIGALSYYAGTSRLSNDAADLGRRGVATLVERVRSEMEHRGVDAATAVKDVIARVDRPVAYHAGRFVALQVYDRAGNLLAEQAVHGEPGMADVAADLAKRPFSFPVAGNVDAGAARVAGAPFVLVTMAVTGREASKVVYVRGMFAVSPEAVSEMRRSVLRNALFVAVIVLAVAALLYPVILQLMRTLSDYSTHLLDANLEVLDTLGCAIAKRDSDTDAHNYRVSLYSARIGEAMALSEDDMRSLIKGAFLHDVGKIGIPDNILLKPGKLDDAEYAVMKTHVDKGLDIVQRSTWLRDGGDVVGCHHEKYAGGGYPRGLHGEAIPITARIFAVSDVFDALASHRPYKKPLSFEETMDILEKDRGRHFDPRVLDAFGTVAKDLYGRYAGRESSDLRGELQQLVERYYSAGMDTLRYGEGAGHAAADQGKEVAA